MDRFEELGEKVTPLLSPYARRVAVFGSFVRGEHGPESDVDILVDLKPPGERPPLGLRWFGLEEELGRLLGHRVDLVSNSALSPHVRPYVEREMVTLYEEKRRRNDKARSAAPCTSNHRSWRRDTSAE